MSAISRILQAEDRAVALRGQVDVAEDVAAVDGGEERFRAILDPLHRQAELLRDAGGDVLLGVDVDFGAEAAADLGGDRPDLVSPRPCMPDTRFSGCAGSAWNDQMVSCSLPGSQCATTPRGSIGIGHEPLVHHPLGDHDVSGGKGGVDPGVVNGPRRRRCSRCRPAPGGRRGCSRTSRG